MTEDMKIKVKHICSMTSCPIAIMDNGNGAVLFEGTAQEAAFSKFAPCLFEAISTERGFLQLWLPREE